MKSVILQQTISHVARVSGRGYWSGQPVSLTFRPAPPDTGIVFRRIDLPGRPVLRAIATHRVDTPLRTKLVAGSAEVEMVEHVMAALYGMHIDNCVVETDACEMPGLDGSASAIALAIQQAGVSNQGVPADILVLDDELAVGDSQCGVAARPSRDRELTLVYHLDFGPESYIPSSTSMAILTPHEFLHHIAPARTFLTENDARELQRMGVAQHVTYRDLLIFGSQGPIDNSLHFPDECSRHKLLDLIGDLALCGMRVHGTIIARKSGHNLNGKMARKLMALHEQMQSHHRRAA